jgi:transketolase C-terminal domain/subunit
MLATRGIEVSVFSCPQLAQEAGETFKDLWRHRVLISVEEHGSAGGFGSFLKELAPPGVEIQIRGIPSRNCSLVGGQDFLWTKAGLDADSLAATAVALLGEVC